MFRKLFTFILLFSYQIVFSDTLIIQSTTSTRDSGLYKYLLPFYPDLKNNEINIVEKMIVVNNNNVKPIITDDNKYDNEYFKNNYENLPDCPFDPCMSCDNNNKFTELNGAFKDNLIEKYRIKKNE